METPYKFKVTVLLKDGSKKAFIKLSHYKNLNHAKSALDYTLQFRCDQAQDINADHHSIWGDTDENYSLWKSYSIHHLKT